MSSGPLDGSAAPQLPDPPSRRRRRPKPPPTAYNRSSGSSIDLPAGHGAHVFPIGSSTGFVGEAFSMDSLEFMRWAAIQYDDDRFVLVVLFTLMGSQKPGGLIEATHEDVAQHLRYSRSHVSRAINVLEADGVLRRQQKGVYQLNPAASLRGGLREPEKGAKRRSRANVGDRVEQLDLLREIMDDPDAPEAFRAMAAPGAKLEVREGTDGEGKATS
ncbi:helix-turn-helix domain-containing protein [Streptomyces aureoverticillatus]|uniref:helix-turn-helix domain-containing protein n=1 Tax=Streptomyces aureoverticillatus TaxID=66871 RepID=UPI0013DC5A1C|nr:helix-turn-helix domain-containing protein [Streptomyces aureoverticillatus]QIB49468.1 winged helix-turn-helix domain-containing protein [Streptomyces aureoverticillatus]